MSNQIVAASQPNQQLIVVSNEQLLAALQPKPPTKMSLMTSPETVQQIGKIIAHLESRGYITRNAEVFVDKAVKNHFEDVLATIIPKDAPPFRIDEWFHDRRSQTMSKAMRNYDPTGYDVPPPFTGVTVNWMGELLEMELQYPGLIALMYNCIAMEETIFDEVEKAKARGMRQMMNAPMQMPAHKISASDPLTEIPTSNVLNFTAVPLQNAYPFRPDTL